MFPDKRCLSHHMCLYHVMMTLHFLNEVANDTKIENYVIIASLKSETMGKLINRIPGSRLLISSLPAWPRKYAHSGFSSLVQSLLPKDTLLRTYLRTYVESAVKSPNVNKCSQSLAW